MLTEEQRIQRKNGIGASDAAAAAAMSPWCTQYELYLEKIADYVEERNDFERDFKFIEGNLLEDVVAAMYTMKTGAEVHEPRQTIYHPEYPFIYANLDRALTHQPNYYIECKTTNDFTFSQGKWGTEGSSDMPMQYLLQCAHQAMVGNAEAVDLAVYVKGLKSGFYIYTYQRNYELEAALLARELNFWNEHVLKRVPPAPVTYEEASQQFPESEPTQISVNADMRDALDSYIKLSDEIKKKSKAADELKRLLALYMKKNEQLLDMNGSLVATWKASERKSLDTQQLKKDYPDIYEECLKTSTSRTFRTIRRKD